MEGDGSFDGVLGKNFIMLHILDRGENCLTKFRKLVGPHYFRDIFVLLDTIIFGEEAGIEAAIEHGNGEVFIHGIECFSDYFCAFLLYRLVCYLVF